jgi:hypothetical protein
MKATSRQSHARFNNERSFTTALSFAPTKQNHQQFLIVYGGLEATRKGQRRQTRGNERSRTIALFKTFATMKESDEQFLHFCYNETVMNIM